MELITPIDVPALALSLMVFLSVFAALLLGGCCAIYLQGRKDEHTAADTVDAILNAQSRMFTARGLSQPDAIDRAANLALEWTHIMLEHRVPPAWDLPAALEHLRADLKGGEDETEQARRQVITRYHTW